MLDTIPVGVAVVGALTATLGSLFLEFRASTPSQTSTAEEIPDRPGR